MIGTQRVAGACWQHHRPGPWPAIPLAGNTDVVRGLGAFLPGMAAALSSRMHTTQTIPIEPNAAFTGCCPRFAPEPFQEKEIVWRDELFVKEHVRSLFHVPLNMSRRMVAANALIDAAGARPTVPLTLSDEKSSWGADLYLHATKQVPGASMVKLSGRYLTKVFEGPFRDAPKWVRRMTQFVQERGEQLDKIYFAYTTCPACAKVYGTNYVVLFARLRDCVEIEEIASPTSEANSTCRA